MVHDVIVAVRSAKLDPRDRHLALMLATYVNDRTYLAYPSVDLLAKQLAVRPCTVQRSLQRLRALGVVRVESRQVVGSTGQLQPAGGRGVSTKYRFQLDVLAALSPETVAPVRPILPPGIDEKGRTGDGKGSHWRRKTVAPVRPESTRPYMSTKSSGADAPRSRPPTLDELLDGVIDDHPGQSFAVKLHALQKLPAARGIPKRDLQTMLARRLTRRENDTAS